MRQVEKKTIKLSVARYILLSAICMWYLCSFQTTVAQTGNSCVDCHASSADKRLREPTLNAENDVHIQRGLLCHRCHGGDPDHGYIEKNPDLAHSPNHGWRRVPSTREIPEFCARCHADVEYMKQYNPKLRVDQLLEYRSSRHGKLLSEGDKKVAQCVSCHGVHGILPVTDSRSPVHRANIPATCGQCHADEAYMSDYAIPTNQLEQYGQSVHGRQLLEKGDAAAPACNDCHGNHGATPPGLTSIANACGECHAINRDFFNQSPHKTVFEEMELGECNTCHGHHDTQPATDDMLGIGENSMCITCHDEDAGFMAARTMREQLDSLKAIIAEADNLLERAEQGGVDVKSGKFDLQQVKSTLIKARGAVHYFDPAKLAEIVQPAIEGAQLVEQLGQGALDDLRMRRVGLAFSIPLIMLIALALYLKIRRMEAMRKNH